LETSLPLEDTPLTTISETVTIDTTTGSKIEPSRTTTQKTKNVRKTIPIPSTIDDKKIKIDPEEVIRYNFILLFSSFLIFCFL
jgi:hypothetical protein